MIITRPKGLFAERQKLSFYVSVDDSLPCLFLHEFDLWSGLDLQPQGLALSSIKSRCRQSSNFPIDETLEAVCGPSDLLSSSSFPHKKL